MRLRSLAATAALVFAGGFAPAAAQTPAADSAALARVVAHIDGARFDSARAHLDEWQAARSGSARPTEQALANLLDARLERDGVAAQHAWLSLALAHPFGPDAGFALLRVGQAALLQGDTSGARVYLTRLIDDFPGSGQLAEAHLWLSRVHARAGRATAACSSARAGLAAAGSAEVLGLLRLQEQSACAARDAAPADPVAVSPQPTTVEGRFAVQSGAFRTRSGADDLMDRLRTAGFQPRLVRVPANDLMRVRVGGFDTSAAAAALRDRLLSARFDAVVVDNANRESPVE